MKKPTKFRRFLVKLKRLFVISKMQTVDGGNNNELVGKNMVDVLLQHYEIEEQTDIVRAMQLQLIVKRKEQIERTAKHLHRLNEDLKLNESFMQK